MQLCPLCVGGFERHVVDYVELDLCTTCGAAWFDKGELTELVGSKISGREGGRRLHCPSCTQVALESPAHREFNALVLVCENCEGCLLSREHYEALVRPSDGSSERRASARFWLVELLAELGIGIASA